MSREQDYISEVRAASKAVWDGINKLVSLKREWDALAYGDNLPDGEGANAGYTRADVGAVVFAATDGLVLTLNGSGGQPVAVGSQAGNMAKLL